MEALTEGYLRALGESTPERRRPVWALLSTTEQQLSEQFNRFAADFAKVSDEDARVSRLPIALPFADKLFPAATFDMRKALAIHAKGITHVMQNTGHLSAKDRAYMMTAELFLMQHTCHWYCKSKTVASGPHDGPPPDAARAAGQLGVRAHAQGLLGAHPGPLRRQSPTGCSMTAPLTDSLGNPVTLRDERSLAAINDFVEGFIACEARAVNVLQAQADASPLVQAYCAALHMFAESADAPRNARPFIEQALAHAHQASEREQRLVAAVAAWVDGDLPRAIALHEEQARLHPRDLASLKLGPIPPVQPRRLARHAAAGPASAARRRRCALPARHAGLWLGAMPPAQRSRSRRPPRHPPVPQRALGPPRTGPRHADPGPHLRKASTSWPA